MTKKKIMIVEDEALVMASIKMIVERNGYSVSSTVSSGEEAIKEIEKNKPDLILMDIVLNGDLDGIESAEAIREILDIPILYVTAHTDKKIVTRAKITEPFGYITKPIDERKLSISIEIALYNDEMKKKKQHLLEEIKILRGILPICSFCKKIRNDDGYWEQLEVYISSYSEAKFTHGICPICRRINYPDH